MVGAEGAGNVVNFTALEWLKNSVFLNFKECLLTLQASFYQLFTRKS